MGSLGRGMTLRLAVTALLALINLSLGSPEHFRRHGVDSSYPSDLMQWGLKTDSSLDRSLMNNMAVEGLLSMSRGQPDRPFQLAELSEFRNAASGDLGDQAGRRMSITNAMDILRDRLLSAIKRKHVNLDSREGLRAEPGLVSI